VQVRRNYCRGAENKSMNFGYNLLFFLQIYFRILPEN
jgi:hypothetical protein